MKTGKNKEAVAAYYSSKELLLKRLDVLTEIIKKDAMVDTSDGVNYCHVGELDRQSHEIGLILGGFEVEAPLGIED